MKSQTFTKKLINGNLLESRLLPIEYPWAWEHYLNGCANHWMPHEVPMDDDIAFWKSSTLSAAEKKVFVRSFGFFSTAETVVSNNIALAIYKYITAPEARIYLLRQAFEETVHAHAFLYISEALQLDGEEIFNMYLDVPVVREKDNFALRLTENILDPAFSMSTQEGSEQFVEMLAGYYLILEGLFFYGGFALALAFQRQNRMQGVAQLYEFILRDETIHLNFGMDLINGIKEENPGLWTRILEERLYAMMREAVRLEKHYLDEVVPQEGILGMQSHHFHAYIEYLADRRLKRVGLKPLFGSKNPLHWMSEIMDLYKEKNFFERTVEEYRTKPPLKWS